MKYYIFCVLYVIAYGLSAQNDKLTTTKKEKTVEAIISYSLGISLLGGAQAISDQMTRNGFIDDDCVLLCINESYPKKTSRISYELDIAIFLNDNSGFSLGVGKMKSYRVTGYDTIDEYLFGGLSAKNRLEIKDRRYVANLNYIYRSDNKKHFLYLGPSLMKKDFETNFATYKPLYKLGGHIAYQFNFAALKPKSTMRAIRLSYSWFSKSTIGPYVREDSYVDSDGGVSVFTSTFEQMNISNQSINVHFVFGIPIE